MAQRLILASGSPRRHRILERAGVRFEIDVPDVDERVAAHEAPDAMVARLAMEKATVVAERHSGALVLGCDTTVAKDSRIYGKPTNVADARRMLAELSGTAHVAMTAFCIVQGRETIATEVVRTRVVMKEIEAEEAEAYIATGEPMDKAGGYGFRAGQRHSSTTSRARTPTSWVCRSTRSSRCWTRSPPGRSAQ